MRPVAPRRRHAPGRGDRRGGRRRARDDGRAPAPTTTRAPGALADVLAERVPGQRRSRARSRPTSCAPAPRALPPTIVADARRARACCAGTIDVDTVRFVTHKDVDDAGLGAGRRRARRRGRRAERLTATFVACAASADDVPASALAVYAHPDDPEIAAGGTLAKWAGGGHRGVGAHHRARRQGHAGSRRRSRRARRAAGARRRPRRRRSSASPGTSTSATPTASCPTTRSCAARSSASSASSRPEVVLCPDPTAVFFGDGYFNHHDHRVTGWATLDAVAPAAGQPALLPRAHRARASRCTRCARSTCRARSSRTAGSTSATRSSARSTRLFCHASQLADAGDWFREFLRERAEDGRRRRRRRATPRRSGELTFGLT